MGRRMYRRTAVRGDVVQGPRLAGTSLSPRERAGGEGARVDPHGPCDTAPAPIPARLFSALGRFLARRTPTCTLNALDAAAAGDVDELRIHLLREPTQASGLKGPAGESALHRAVSQGRL